MIYYWVDSLGSFNWRILVVMSKSTGDWYNLLRKFLDEVHWGTWLVVGGTIFWDFECSLPRELRVLWVFEYSSLGELRDNLMWNV
jgi:hypothetical protein